MLSLLCYNAWPGPYNVWWWERIPWFAVAGDASILLLGYLMYSLLTGNPRPCSS